MRTFNKIKAHLSDDTAEMNLQMVILIAIAFIVGAIVIGAIIAVINSGYKPGMTSKIRSWLD